jgi:hypothetical protein
MCRKFGCAPDMSAHSAFIPYWQQGWIFIYLKGGVEIFLVGCKRHHSVSFRKNNLFAKQNLIGAQTHRQTDIKTDTFYYLCPYSKSSLALT